VSTSGADASPALSVGAVVDLEVGAVAHGGSCVARHDGRVVFVRHALPGEQVRAAITDASHERYLLADAIEILEASPDRVEPPCPYARPGRCGGCDWQHASGERQRRLKAEVVREQFRRLAAVDLPDAFAVERLTESLLGWRTRIAYATDRNGMLGLHRHHSSTVELIDRCLIGAPGVGDSDVLQRRWPGVTGVEVAGGDDGVVSVLTRRPGPGRQARGRRPPDRIEVVDGPRQLVRRAGDRSLTVAASGFWQVHPRALDAFAAAVLDLAAPAGGESVLDLYCGAGALTSLLAAAVGPSGRVVGVESDAQAAADAERNLAGSAGVEVRRARVTADLLRSFDLRPDVVVLDPPRAGAGRDVMTAVLGLRPRVVAYVACDPASLARDVRTALDGGWRLSGLRAFDAFPMTHHVECVAALSAP
jgi:tRNA/tmRNA/rRNA uracil-C5-methylase (TrmA/RlmC/RlmD family)